jgi:hypothetical protein
MKKISTLLILVAIIGSVQTLKAQTKKKKVTTTSKVAKQQATTKSKDMLSLLQGRWASTEDKKTFFEVQGDKQVNFYGKDIIDTATVNFYNEYPEHISATDPKQTSGKYMVVEIRKNDFYIYSVEQLTATSLTLMYLPKGSLLHYKKVR